MPLGGGEIIQRQMVTPAGDPLVANLQMLLEQEKAKSAALAASNTKLVAALMQAHELVHEMTNAAFFGYSIDEKIGDFYSTTWKLIGKGP